ncbi:MAG TPA: serine hydrolase domain-containing protein [Pyrinomonadaceae bacterium]|nr:serine hydrolase domain-containing protein [Pyrinomonadaceae bacterium]
MNRRTIILLLIVCLVTATAFGQKPSSASNTTAPKEQAGRLRSSLEQQIQLKLDEWHKAGKFPGATLGVVLANGGSFSLAVGYSDALAKTPMKPNDRMLAGSVGKTFAAATALQLVKEGKINLDEKIEKYLGREPWFSRLPNAKDITVRQLMNHTSGLVRYEFKEQFTRDLTANPEKRWQPAELVAYLLDEKAPFAAGLGWDYSDTNYIVLGMIIEKVTGKKFYEEANRRIIKPLKLRNTIPQDCLKLAGVVQGYAGPNNPFGGKDEMIHAGKFIINPQFEWTGGGYASTAEDLARWAKMIYEGRAYSADLLPQVLDGVPAPMLGRETRYGLGVIIRKTAAGTSYGHSGFFPGYMTDMMYFPEQKIAIAVQVNTSVPRDLGKPLSRVILEVFEIVNGADKRALAPVVNTERRGERHHHASIRNRFTRRLHKQSH